MGIYPARLAGDYWGAVHNHGGGSLGGRGGGGRWNNGMGGEGVKALFVG